MIKLAIYSDDDPLTISKIVEKHLQAVVCSSITCNPIKDPLEDELVLRDIQLQGGQVSYNGLIISMSYSLYNLLHYFLVNRGLIRTPNQLCNYLWPDDQSYERSDALKKKIQLLRATLYPNPGKSFIHTVYGIGYVIYNIS